MCLRFVCWLSTYWQKYPWEYPSQKQHAWNIHSFQKPYRHSTRHMTDNQQTRSHLICWHQWQYAHALHICVSTYMCRWDYIFVLVIFNGLIWGCVLFASAVCLEILLLLTFMHNLCVDIGKGWVWIYSDIKCLVQVVAQMFVFCVWRICDWGCVLLKINLRVWQLVFVWTIQAPLIIIKMATYVFFKCRFWKFSAYNMNACTCPYTHSCIPLWLQLYFFLTVYSVDFVKFLF